MSGILVGPRRRLLGRPLPRSTPVEAHPTHICRCIDVIFFRPKGHSVINKYFVLLNKESVYHIFAIRVNEISWAHV
jgi:hypothetical protein